MLRRQNPRPRIRVEERLVLSVSQWLRHALRDVAGPGDRFFYDYDFGDSWEHEVTVERVGSIPQVLKLAVCVDGENACPPEDVGGTGGYADLLNVLADPTHEDFAHFISWVGEGFDPARFDLAEVNAALHRIR